MIVPAFWAEAVASGRRRGRPVSVRRFGWSDVGEAEAQARAEERAAAALKRLLAGDKLPRREPKVPYNGADGVPIREEILARHGDAVVTRNSYGAHCLNTPDVLFADVDFAREPSPLHVLSLAAAGMLAAVPFAIWRGWGCGMYLLIGIGIPWASWMLLASWIRMVDLARGGAEAASRARIRRFLQSRPGWRLRVYRTPAGFRVLALHRRFDPLDPEVEACFAALRTDPIYRRMCRHQRCFRARLTPKPWRIGIEAHMKPRPGVWPVRPERKADRARWVAEYESKREAYAACRFVEELGEGPEDPAARAIQILHDDLAGAVLDLPLA